eukprot:Gregarina_sp_Poly_1__3551@NODE_2038_length_2796_cov_321_424698_g1315_i0_p4_GENE_NODE_2038_length_2796_cov_321_424698_g1315_i0NODE_2038_length_2796_cov_321_424698_g1315_i0_p4_ORF_typecomplete_len115_score9_16_NODE_2038_length_2796_cov_321_424698_g1315_i023422686
MIFMIKWTGVRKRPAILLMYFLVLSRRSFARPRHNRVNRKGSARRAIVGALDTAEDGFPIVLNANTYQLGENSLLDVELLADAETAPPQDSQQYQQLKQMSNLFCCFLLQTHGR